MDYYDENEIVHENYNNDNYRNNYFSKNLDYNNNYENENGSYIIDIFPNRSCICQREIDKIINDYYSNIVREAGADIEIVFANQAPSILEYTDCVITCDIHSRMRNKRILKNAGAKTVLGLDDILNAPVGDSGYNEKYGLLGSNKSTEDKVKLFPRDCQHLVEDIQKEMLKLTGKHVEVMVYGDGAFKDPKGKIWELADPVVSPAFTDGLVGTPNELKLKYLADNDFKHLSGQELKDAISKSIKEKGKNLVGNMASQGTTPRQLTDLIGSLCDLTSGSGDKGTPFILIQGYFDSFID